MMVAMQQPDRTTLTPSAYFNVTPCSISGNHEDTLSCRERRRTLPLAHLLPDQTLRMLLHSSLSISSSTSGSANALAIWSGQALGTSVANAIDLRCRRENFKAATARGKD